MTAETLTSAAGATTPAAVPVRPGFARRSLKWVTGHLGLVPFLAYTGVFLGAPVVMVALGALQDNDGAFTTDNLGAAFKDQFGRSFVTSIELSALTAVLGAVLGALLAHAVLGAKPDGLLRKVVSSAAGVLANFGGVPLAFAFIATLGSIGIVTKALTGLGLDLYASGFSLFSFSGIAIVYVYFQIPLVPIQIGSLVSGNVVADQQNLGKALGLGMIVVVAVVMAFYSWMQRRASRWLG